MKATVILLSLALTIFSGKDYYTSAAFAFTTSSASSRNLYLSRSLVLQNIQLFSTNNEFLEFNDNAPNPDASPDTSKYYESLPSSYPPGIPASLRGEAIRSALTTTDRCLIWSNDGGILSISGKGTLDFLHNKLTADFLSPTENSGSSNSNSKQHNSILSFQEACFLDAKGRLVDWLRVSSTQTPSSSSSSSSSSDPAPPQALILTSFGSYTSVDILAQLDPFVFPMDQVTLTNYDSTQPQENAFCFSVAATQFETVRKVLRDLQDTDVRLPLSASSMVFPSGIHQSALWKVNDQLQILVVPSVGLPSVACVGYALVFFGSSEAMKLGKSVYDYLISDNNADGPIEVGPRELETLRVEAGQPGYGHEFGKKLTTTNEGGDKDDSNMIKTSPLELHWKATLDLDKGCYLGQEGIASVLKNTRGPPRLLYAVVFKDDFNCYEPQSRGGDSDLENLTTLPQPGQKLYALGSNEELMVGTITSMGEAGGTGNPDTVALALVKRADSVQKQMKELGLEIPRHDADFSDTDVMTGSGMLQPPAMDPLVGLEVVVEGTFTVGVLKSIPSRRLRRDENMLSDLIQVQELNDKPRKMTPTQEDTPAMDESDLLEDIEAQAAKAVEEAEKAAEEAKRKAEKMEMLQKRAKEAMARRKQKKQ